MAFKFTRKNSPYIYIGYYEKLEADQKKKYKPFSTKLRKDVAKDRKEAEQMVARINAGMQEHYLQNRFKVIGKSVPKLSDGLNLYYDFRIGLKEKTKNIYRLAVDHFITCNEDKQVNVYTNNHFSKFVAFLKQRNSSPHTQAIYLRHLKALFEFFVNEQYIEKNLTPTVKAPKKMVVAIPLTEVKVILNYFKNKITDPTLSPYHQQRCKLQYHLVKFLLFTGMRISSALAQTWENILWEQGQMKVINVKANNREYMFPLHTSLLKLLTEEMGGGIKGMLFDYSVERGTPVFWKLAINKLYDNNKITAKYTLHQLRKTFGTIIRRSGEDLSTVKDLLDHSNIRVTADHYSEDMTTTLYKTKLDHINFGDEDESKG